MATSLYAMVRDYERTTEGVQRLEENFHRAKEGQREAIQELTDYMIHFNIARFVYDNYLYELIEGKLRVFDCPGVFDCPAPVTMGQKQDAAEAAVAD